MENLAILYVPLSAFALVAIVWGLSAWLDRHEDDPYQDTTE